MIGIYTNGAAHWEPTG